MEITVNVDHYFDQDDLAEMVEDEVRSVIRRNAERRYGTEAITKMVEAAAHDVVKKMVEDQSPEVFSELAEKTRDIIKDLKSWHVFCETDVSTGIGVPATRKTRGQQLLDEAVEELQPYLKERAKELLDERLGMEMSAACIIDAVTDAFYEKLREQLKED